MKKNRLHILQNIFLFLSIISCVLYSFFDVLFTKKNFHEGSNNVAIVLDVSKSMNVVDMPKGSRLREAKLDIYSLITQNPLWNYALVIFAGESQRVTPFTQDVGFFTTVLQGVDYKNITKQGTNLNAAIADAIVSFGDSKTGLVIIYSDGDDSLTHVSEDILEQLLEAQLEIYVVGVGTPQGGYIPTGDSFSPVKLYNGEKVIAKKQTENLKQFAQDVGGSYIDIGDEFSLQYENTDKKRNLYEILFILSLIFWGGFLYLLYKKKYGKN